MKLFSLIYENILALLLYSILKRIQNSKNLNVLKILQKIEVIPSLVWKQEKPNNIN